MQPDELTHRLWWKLGDYLRGEMTSDDFFVWWDCERPRPHTWLGYTPWYPRQLSQGALESLYSEMTWQLMDSTP